MATSLEKVFREALALPDESKALLAERLVEHLATRMAPDLQRRHLEILRERMEQVRCGAVDLVDGAEALRAARRKLG